MGLIFPEIFASPLSEFEQHMYSSDPRPDTGLLMQLESRRAVPQALQLPIIQSLSQDILIIPQLDGREVKNTADFGITHISFIFLFFDSKPGSCQPICGIIIANKSFSSAKAAFVRSFRPSGKNRRHLGCSIVMRRRGYAVQNKGITLICFSVIKESLAGYNTLFSKMTLFLERDTWECVHRYSCSVI